MMDHHYDTFITYQANTDRETIAQDVSAAIERWTSEESTNGFRVDDHQGSHDPVAETIIGSITGRNIDGAAIRRLFARMGHKWSMTFEIEVEWPDEKTILYCGSNIKGYKIERTLHQIALGSQTLRRLMKDNPETSQTVIDNLTHVEWATLDAIEWLAATLRDGRPKETD